MKLRRAAKWPITFLLRAAPVRRRLIFELKLRYFSDLGIRVPLSNGWICPVTAEDHWCSFSEIFLQHEYRPILEVMPLPRRWIDLGCHAGYFSLWLASQGPKEQPRPEALLVDADPRVHSAVRQVTLENNWESAVRFAHGAIAAPGGHVQFLERRFMASTVAEGPASRSVPVISAAQLQELFSPPYDLIKIDVEGSEYDFLVHYRSVIHRAQYLLLEWHACSENGRDRTAIQRLARESGYELAKEIVAPKLVEWGNDTRIETGVDLYRNTHRNHD